jgi:AraC-like DNA-binding protein
MSDDSVSDAQVVQLITGFIKSNYSSKHTYDSLARMACVSRSKLFSAFKKVTGKTIGKYIEAVRLDRACSLLSEGNATVLDIMLETGYNDMKMFCKRFKEYVNMTPTEYRRKHKGE